MNYSFKTCSDDEETDAWMQSWVEARVKNAVIKQPEQQGFWDCPELYYPFWQHH